MTMAKTAITAALIGLAVGYSRRPSSKNDRVGVELNGTMPSEVSSAQACGYIALGFEFPLGYLGDPLDYYAGRGWLMFPNGGWESGSDHNGKKIVTYALLGVVVALSRHWLSCGNRDIFCGIKFL